MAVFTRLKSGHRRFVLEEQDDPTVKPLGQRALSIGRLALAVVLGLFACEAVFFVLDHPWFLLATGRFQPSSTYWRSVIAAVIVSLAGCIVAQFVDRRHAVLLAILVPFANAPMGFVGTSSWVLHANLATIVLALVSAMILRNRARRRGGPPTMPAV